MTESSEGRYCLSAFLEHIAGIIRDVLGDARLPAANGDIKAEPAVEDAADGSVALTADAQPGTPRSEGSLPSDVNLRRETSNRVIIVGGGASGVLLACHLLRDPNAALTVTLIEKRSDIGQGIAFSTVNPDHVLNVRAANMSAFAEDPEHFWRWLVAHRTGESLRYADPFCFAPRRLYGRYIASLIEPLHEAGRAGRLDIVQGECVDVRVLPSAVVATLADGSTHAGDILVLATGHETSPTQFAGWAAHPWTLPSDAGIATDASVLILGTGLTMVDFVLALENGGHRGLVTAMSRRGLLPHVHRRTAPVHIAAEEVPFGADPATLLRWFRNRANRIVADGGDWRSIVDAVRPFTQKLWHTLPLASRRQFLRHARAWWDVHRHRMAPEIEMRLTELIAQGRLRILAGKVCSVESEGPRARVSYRLRGTEAIETMEVARIVECRGIVTDPSDTRNPVLLSLLEQGLVRADPLRIGIEVTGGCAVVDRMGEPSDRLFAVGPLTRAAFWEIVAVPDIRVQCAELAARIGARLIPQQPVREQFSSDRM